MANRERISGDGGQSSPISGGQLPAKRERAMSGKTESELLAMARAASEAAIMAAIAGELTYDKLSHNRMFGNRGGEAAAIRELCGRERAMSIAAAAIAAAGDCESDCTVCGGESGENCRHANYYLMAGESECEAMAAILMSERAAGDAIAAIWHIWRAIRIADCHCELRRNCPIAAMMAMGERARIAAIDLLRAWRAMAAGNRDNERRAAAAASELARAAAAIGELRASLAGECKAGDII